MATPFRLKRSALTGKRPGLADLEKGELAINFYDGNLYAERDTGGVGIGTTIANLTPWKEQFSRNEIFYSGIVSATTYHGDQIIGTPTGGSFRAGAYTPVVTEKTKDSIDELNYILGKLVPEQPTTMDGVSLTLTGTTGTYYLCAGFTPTNNTGGAAPSAGSAYTRNTDQTVTTNWLTEYGPGDSGTVTGHVNAVGVGTTTLNISFGLYAVKSDNGTYGSLQIANDKDAADSTRNVGITSLFYEVCDRRLVNAPCPNGYNKAHMTHGSATTGSVYWYEDPSTVGVPDMTFGTVTTPDPASHQVVYSSGVPHYTNTSANTFSYVITVTNCTGDMYYSNHNRLLWAEGATTGFTRPDQYKLFNEVKVNGVSGTHPPQRNFGVGTGATVTATHTPNNIHNTITSSHFHRWDCWTPYGSDQNERATISQAVNIMGGNATTSQVDEDNINITGSLGVGSGNAVRTTATAASDNPTPSTTAFNANTTPPAVYEAIVRGGYLRHDQTNYSTGYLPVGPNLGSGRSGAQYFQVFFTRTSVSEFNINVSGSYSGCWVCMPDNSTWTTGLNSTNGWADMFAAYSGSGTPNNANTGCSDGGAMSGSSGTFKCVFGEESSSNGAGKILVRFKLASGQSISTMSFSAT